MTLLFWIIAALCFIAWIHAAVRWRLCRLDWKNAIYWKGRIEEDRDEHRKRLYHLQDELTEYVMDGRDFDLVEAVVIIRRWKELAKERDELHKTLVRVAEALAIERAVGNELVQFRKKLNEQLNERTMPFLDSVTAEYGTAATDEPEERNGADSQ